ncbi:hypothetical protein KIN20_025222 [Parelaphostrongylus tenuis]|uniref:C2H2-type domain-containing protein n=1 Tax=Parelaphostrongylus tenuis TaxID=148309 RepID=A0AAD5N8K7_PARTN|nr:hypothetical protein KIN20_025222 [Parelaphostrongylus tenuis]
MIARGNVYVLHQISTFEMITRKPHLNRTYLLEGGCGCNYFFDTYKATSRHRASKERQDMADKWASDPLQFDVDVNFDDDLGNPIIGEDVFLTEPYKCTDECICKELLLGDDRFRNSSDVSSNRSPQQCSPNATDSLWNFYVDPTFADHDFPPLPPQSSSWEDIFADHSFSSSGNNFIKEIFIEDRHSLQPSDVVEAGSPKIVEPRKKFQRFREKRFICDECNRSFTMKQNVQQHLFQSVLQYHNPNGNSKTPVRNTPRRFQCTKCMKIFKSLDKAQKHEARMHGERAAPVVYACKECNKVYSVQSQLKEHIDVVHQYVYFISIF